MLFSVVSESAEGLGNDARYSTSQAESVEIDEAHPLQNAGGEIGLLAQTEALLRTSCCSGGVRFPEPSRCCATLVLDYGLGGQESSDVRRLGVLPKRLLMVFIHTEQCTVVAKTRTSRHLGQTEPCGSTLCEVVPDTYLGRGSWTQAPSGTCISAGTIATTCPREAGSLRLAKHGDSRRLDVIRSAHRLALLQSSRNGVLGTPPNVIMVLCLSSREGCG